MLQENIGIPGSNLYLIYRSSWATGYYSYLIIHLTQSEISPELQNVYISIEIEGSIYNHLLEADPNLKYTFTWDKRNVYKQKVSFLKLYCYSVECNIYFNIRLQMLIIFIIVQRLIGLWNCKSKSFDRLRVQEL